VREPCDEARASGNGAARGYLEAGRLWCRNEAPPAHEPGCGTGKPKTAAAGAFVSALLRTTRLAFMKRPPPPCLSRRSPKGEGGSRGEKLRFMIRRGDARGNDGVCSR
jgi:hypothetical protein